MRYLKENQKKIEFLLLFIPTAYIGTGLWNGAVDLSSLVIYKSSTAFTPMGLGEDLESLISLFTPYLLWKIFAKYLLD